jgi:hypothetical protein
MLSTIMRRIATAGLCALALASACVPLAARSPAFPAPVADPSAVIAAELAFARAAREKGQWTAFRDYAAKDALWLNPDVSLVQTDLAGRADPPKAISWEPDRVWSSCDGSFAITSGPAHFPSGASGRFVTVWQRQGKGDFRWVLDQGFDLEGGYAPPDMISAQIAECPAGERPKMIRSLPKPRRGEAWQTGHSDDGTLTWTTRLSADCTRKLTVSLAREKGPETVFTATTSPRTEQGEPAPSCTPTT